VSILRVKYSTIQKHIFCDIYDSWCNGKKFPFITYIYTYAWNNLPESVDFSRCPDSNERLNGFDLAILGFRFFGLVLLDCIIVLVYYWLVIEGVCWCTICAVPCASCSLVSQRACFKGVLWANKLLLLLTYLLTKPHKWHRVRLQRKSWLLLCLLIHSKICFYFWFQ